MNNTAQSSSFQVLYLHYKNSFLYPISIIVAIFLTAIGLVYYVVIPQYQQWFSIQNEVADTQAKLNILNNNITFISSVDVASLDDELKSANTALPANRVF